MRGFGAHLPSPRTRVPTTHRVALTVPESAHRVPASLPLPYVVCFHQPAREQLVLRQRLAISCNGPARLRSQLQCSELLPHRLALYFSPGRLSSAHPTPSPSLHSEPAPRAPWPSLTALSLPSRHRLHRCHWDTPIDRANHLKATPPTTTAFHCCLFATVPALSTLGTRTATDPPPLNKHPATPHPWRRSKLPLTKR